MKPTLPLGIITGLIVGALWFTPAADAHRPKCHTSWCQETFRLKPHHRAIYKPKARTYSGEEIHVQVEIKGQLVYPRPLGVDGCAAEFNAYGTVVVADACIRRNHLTFILTNTMPHKAKVTIRYEFLAASLVG